MSARDRGTSASSAALVGLAGLASAMGVGRFAFTPLLPLMQDAGALTLARGGGLAAANYLGYLAGALACTTLAPAPHRAARGGLAAVALFTLGMGVTRAFPAWLALRFLAGVSSAFVLVGISAWALPLLAARRRASWSGWVYAGVGVGICCTGLLALTAGLLRAPPARAWLLLGACSAAIAAAVWRPMGSSPPEPSPPRRDRGVASRGGAWRLALCYGAFGFGYIVPATFLPAAARLLVRDPAVFGWVWPAYGVAAAASTVLCAAWWRQAPPRRLWATAQLAMAVGVLAPAIRTSIATLLFSAVCVGGTFMVVTMAGMQEARAVGGRAAPRLMAAMTSAFALGQLAGPLTVSLLHASPSGAMTVPSIAAAAVLVLGTMALGPVRRRGAAPGALTTKEMAK